MLTLHDIERRHNPLINLQHIFSLTRFADNKKATPQGIAL
jgi:hypothetical protein